MDHQYKEAFCLMLYKCKECGVMEVLWNSRNGVTPFSIPCRHCNSRGLGPMVHEHWSLDTYIENYKPFPGQRIFTDLTKEKYREYMVKRVDAFWDNENNYFKNYKSKEEAVEMLMSEYQEGQPDIIIYE